MEFSQKTVNFLAITKGRDKSLRVIQYFCRMLQGLGTDYKALHDLAEKASKLASSMALVRKVLRFGLPLDLMAAILRRHSSGNLGQFGWVRSLSQLFGVVYYLTDHLLYAYKIGLLKPALNSSAASFTDVVNNFAWLFEDLLCIVADTIDVHNAQIQLQSMRDKNMHSLYSDGQKAYQTALQQKNLLLWDIIRAAGDVPVRPYLDHHFLP